MTVQATQLANFTKPATETKVKANEQIKDNDSEFSGLMKKEAAGKKEETSKVREREDAADSGKELPAEKNAKVETKAGENAQEAKQEARASNTGEEEALAGEGDAGSLLWQQTPLEDSNLAAMLASSDLLGNTVTPTATAAATTVAGNGLSAQAQGLLSRLQAETPTTSLNASTTLIAASWVSQLQSMSDAEGFDDFMQRGFSQFRDQLGSQLSQQLSSDSSLKGFDQIMSQMNAARSAVTPTATPVDPTASVLTQTKSLDIPVGAKQWSEGVGERIQWMMNKGIDQAQIRLSPQHLGPLEIRVSMLNDQANVSIMAQHAVTREALENSLPRLREMLQESNLTLGSMDVGQREAPEQQRQAQGEGGDASGFGGAGLGDEGDGSAELAAAQVVRETQGIVDDFA